MTLVFDTETSGLFNFKLPATHESQPHVVQFAAILLDDDYIERAAFSAIVCPEDWQISKGASDVHGITQEIAERVGLPLAFVLDLFDDWRVRCSTFVAHNFPFDASIMSSALHRTNRTSFDPGWKVCTMRSMTDVMKLPGNYGKWKWPKLAEAYQHCTGQPLEDAHDALVDVRACAVVYRWLRQNVAAEPSVQLVI